MKRQGLLIWVLIGLVPAVLTGCGKGMIETAKVKVYPAVVYVKPIRETFRSGERQRAEVFGSGVIISTDGYVVTNNHVAEKAIEVNCVLGDKEQVPATVVGLDPETDLALLKLNLPPGHAPLTVAEFGNSNKVQAGQSVLALGAPFGFTRSISRGIISNTKRYIGFTTQYQYNLWLQTDAAINPGNSGGPLVDISGRVIGINTLGTWAEGIGFAIPSNVVKDVIRRLLEEAKKTPKDKWPVKVQRAYTGLQLQALKDFKTNSFIDSEAGVLIRSVDQDSPAAKAGIKDGDILLGIILHELMIEVPATNGIYVEDLPILRVFLADLPTNKKTTLLIARKGIKTFDTGLLIEDPTSQKTVVPLTRKMTGNRGLMKVAITPITRGKFEGKDFDCKRWNMTVKEITKFSNPRLHFLHPSGGIYIRGVRMEGNASDAGLRTNDIILKIGKKDIKTLEDVKQVYEAIVKDKTLTEKKVLITIKRGAFTDWKMLNWTKDYLKED